MTHPNKLFDVNDFVAYRDLEKNLLDQVELIYEKEKNISDDLLESLYFVYKNPLLEALNQIDKQNEQNAKTENHHNFDQNLVTCIVSESQPPRAVYQVKGSVGIHYYLFESLKFCSCSSFKFNVLSKNEYIYCKHIIIVKLLKAMNKINFKHVKDTDLVELIKQIH